MAATYAWLLQKGRKRAQSFLTAAAEWAAGEKLTRWPDTEVGVQKVKELWLKSFKKEQAKRCQRIWPCIWPCIQETPSEEEWRELLRCNPESKLVAARNASAAGGYLTSCADYTSSIGSLRLDISLTFHWFRFVLPERLTHVDTFTVRWLQTSFEQHHGEASRLSRGAPIPSLLVNGKVALARSSLLTLRNELFPFKFWRRDHVRAASLADLPWTAHSCFAVSCC